MTDNTREASIVMNGADIRQMSHYQWGPFNAGHAEMRMPDGMVTESWQITISLPFEFALSIAVQR